MRTSGVLNILGKLLLVLSLFLLTPIAVSLYFGDGMSGDFLLCSVLGGLAGGGLVAAFAPEKEMGYRDGFAVVVFSWLGLALLGALPYYFSGVMPAFVDCFFESMSGFTTTGSTILAQVEVLPESVLFWRALTHWLGGMGIIVLTLAILPLLGIAGMQLYQAEVSGPTKDRLSPRIQDTARILWGVYLLLTLALILLLLVGGVGFFDAVCHAFATIATGGFSTHTASIGHFDSIYIETVIIVFMFLSSINFSLHHRALNGNYAAFRKSEELRLYVGLMAGSILVVLAVNWWYGAFPGLGANLRATVFSVVSIMTTTGFGTADFDQWPSASRLLLVIVMCIGGSAGSTSGGIKQVRILLFFKYARLQLHRLVHPHEVRNIKLDGITVPRDVLVSILGFLALYFVFFLTASLMVSATGVDIITGVTAVTATMNGVGPGLGLVGPAQNFGGLSDLAKVVLAFCMLAGRLELYTLVVLLTPAYWKMAHRPVWRWQRKTA